MATGIASVLDKVAPSAPSTSTLSVGVALPGDAEANAVTAIAKLLTEIVTVWNSPAMLAARKRQDLQALADQMDALLLSAQSGNASALAQLNIEASG